MVHVQKKLKKALKKKGKTSKLSPTLRQKLQMSGCKDKPQFKRLCKTKKPLCKSKDFGASVQKQCPHTCGVCQSMKSKLASSMNCKPKPLVAKLKDRFFKASSSLGKTRPAHNARLHSRKSPWVAGKQRKGQWLEVSFPQTMLLSAVGTQGRYNANQWVKYYRFMYKQKKWKWYKGGKWLRGNWNRQDEKKHQLRPIKAKAVRFYPKKWHHKISMRVELYGCPTRKPAAGAFAEKMARHVKKIVDEHLSRTTAAIISAVTGAGSAAKRMQFVKKATLAAAERVKRAAIAAAPDAKTRAALKKRLTDDALHKHVASAVNGVVHSAIKKPTL